MKRHKEQHLSFVSIILLLLLFNIAKIKGQNTPRDDGPALLVKPDSSTVPANTRVSFFCRADGNPIPTIVWRKNGEPINDGRYSTRTLTNGLSTLRIEPVLSSDNDLIISCTADNGVGSPIKAEAKLKVLVESSLPPGFPEIEAHPVLKSVEQGRTAYVTCKVKGDPRPRVLWLRDMMPIDIRSNSRYSVSTLGNPEYREKVIGALMIQQAREDDQGKYECVARNEHGVVHSKAAHIYVKVRRVPPYFTLKLQKLYRVGIGTSLNLTCVAVGYPMPRVFWKRQSDDSYLNNPKTAPIGKNVLTLSNIENSENYTCIAVSDLGNIETSTTVEAKEILPPPRSFHVIETGDCNVRLKWDSVRAITEEDPVQSYVIKYRPKLDAVSSSTLKPISEYAERGGSFREVKVPPSQTTVTIEGLEPYQQYEFVLHAVSALGKGHPTMPIEVQTAETVPGNAPSDVKARPLNSQAVLVQWGPPEVPNGKITGYIVYYTNKALTDEQDKSDWLKKETKAEELMATLSGLEYEKTYYIQVQAKNTKGSGPFSKTVTVITKQGVPGQPSKLIAKPVDSRRILLTWEKPLHSYNIIGYTIRFNVSDTETKELRLTSDIQRHTVDGLRADTMYSFRVAAHSDRGQGAFGDAVTARTLQSAAVVYPELQLSPRNSSKSLILKLKSPIENWNDTIEIEYRKAIPEGSSEQYEDSDETEGSAAIQFEEVQPWFSFEEIAENPEIEITGLISNTFYEARIKAGKSRSDSVLAKTLEDVESSSFRPVPSAPRDLELIQVNASSVKLTWERPEYANGELMGYYIFKEKLLNGEPVDNHVQHEMVIADPNKFHATVTGLEPNTEYAFRVCAFNLQGDGERTPPKKMMTGGMPPSPPRPQSVTMLSDDPPLRARIDWQPPEITYNQPINAYTVYYRPIDSLGSNDGYEKLEVPGTQTYAELTKLFMGKEYEIFVSAGNDDGWSSNATEKLTTSIGVPDGEPLNVRYDISAGQIIMQWDPPAPERRNGNITYYRAILTPLDGSSQRIDRNVTTRSSSYKVNAKHGYTFKVSAATMKGEGPYSPVLNIQPFENALVGPPSNVKVQATSNSSAVIQWDFDETNGNADGFIVKYLHEPVTGQNGRDDTSHWRSQTIMDPKARHLELVRLNSHKPYAFCVLSVKQSRLGQCSDPPITIDKLQPTFMVQNLHIQYKTSQSVALQWEYNGPQPIQFYVKQSGQKKYLNQDLVEKRLVAPGIETKVDGNERSFMWQSLRQYMNYNFQVGVISLQDGTVYWPKELEIRTDPSGPPFVDTPVFLESRQPGTAQIKVKCASEEYGPISHYWIIVVPGNFTKDDVLNIESQFLEKSTAAMKPKISLAAPSAKKVKKAVSDEDEDDDIDEGDNDDDEGFLTEKVKRALDEEMLEASEYVADESLINDSGISSDEDEETRSTPRSKRYLHESKRRLDGIYIAAKIESQEMRQLVKEDKTFVLGDGKSYHGYLNHPLDANNRYSLMMRAFAQNSDSQRQKDRPFEYRAPMQEPVAKLHTDSLLSETFSIRSAANVIGKSNSSITGIIIGIVMLFMVLSMLGCLIGWRFRTKRKGTRVTRHPSITKVALPNNGYGNGNIHEASKLLDAYGRPVINGYEMNSNNINNMDTSMVDMYPTISNGNLQSGNYPTVQLPLPINSSTTGMTGNEIARGVIPIAELGKHIDRLKMNNNDLFVKEFESIDGGQHFTWKASQHEMNKLKNRYTNVTAYDHTRVLLEPIDNIPGSDYINANHIDGYLKSRAYIATQGPTPETMDDFWRMVWEQNSNVIVMLTKLEEGGRPKCEQYWPNRDKTVYGRIVVTILDTVELAHYTIRTFKIDNLILKQAREVKHLQYTAWPDHGVPDHPTPFLMFLKRVKALAAPNAGPIISHCSAGIGRTGAFIAIDCMLERLRHENTVDIYECVTQLRAQRAYMVQTDDQYIFIHDAVLDAAQSGSTEVPSSKLYHHMKRLLQYHPSGQTTDLEIEFSTLGRLKTLNSQCKIANLLENQMKNRSPNVLPFDTTRVILEKINGIKGTDYINASWVDGYRQRCAYIATQAPTQDTTSDFWRMIWEKNSCIIVMLTKLRENGKEKCFEYWPTEEDRIQIDSLIIEPRMDYNMPDYILREFKIIDQRTGDQRTIRQFQFTEWPEHGVPHGAHSFNDFVYQVHKTKSDFGNIGPITVHCNNGAGRTGVFIATGIITDRMNLEHVVDVFTTVKLLRTERQNMVETKDEYEFCYQAAVEYLSNIEDINDQPF